MRDEQGVTAAALAHRPNGHAFHTAIVTTFSVEFAAFEQILLSQFDSSGATNIVLIADRRMMGFALTDGYLPPKEAGRTYVVAGRSNRVACFTPKTYFRSSVGLRE